MASLSMMGNGGNGLISPVMVCLGGGRLSLVCLAFSDAGGLNNPWSLHDKTDFNDSKKLLLRLLELPFLLLSLELEVSGSGEVRRFEVNEYRFLLHVSGFKKLSWSDVLEVVL
ncbi:hypothetical protein NQZ79_g6576 [Umbelopsis isabellina]|nr:hypothetical protein NQZ79_g6576 [Umbelopsis isabellina]